MHIAKAALSLSLIATGALSLASPARAAVVHHQFFVKWAAAKPAPDMHKEAVTDAASAKSGLDCSSGTFAADGTDVDASDVTATSDASGGCKIAASVDATVHEFTASFHDFAGKAFIYKRFFAKSELVSHEPLELKSQ